MTNSTTEANSVFFKISVKKLWKSNIGPLRTPLCSRDVSVETCIPICPGSGRYWHHLLGHLWSGSFILHVRFPLQILMSSREELLPVCPPPSPYNQNLALSALSWAPNICSFLLRFLINGWLRGVLRGLVHGEAVSPFEALRPKWESAMHVRRG